MWYFCSCDLEFVSWGMTLETVKSVFSFLNFEVMAEFLYLGCLVHNEIYRFRNSMQHSHANTRKGYILVRLEHCEIRFSCLGTMSRSRKSKWFEKIMLHHYCGCEKDTYVMFWFPNIWTIRWESGRLGNIKRQICEIWTVEFAVFKTRACEFRLRPDFQRSWWFSPVRGIRVEQDDSGISFQSSHARTSFELSFQKQPHFGVPAKAFKDERIQIKIYRRCLITMRRSARIVGHLSWTMVVPVAVQVWSQWLCKCGPSGCAGVVPVAVQVWSQWLCRFSHSRDHRRNLWDVRWGSSPE
jgi:hypothetical protein